MYRYKAITGTVQVVVKPEYQPHRSVPNTGQHVWAYHVEICNLGQSDIQLRSRYWRIIDAHGRVQEVRGRGVVGEEPLIEAGDCYSYSSGCPLDTDSGIMSGHFEMEADDGHKFEVTIPTFSLDIPDRTIILN
ncbi:Co2+/Mg2+ efflux protein ApaG [Cohaesibacter celericrescens]|uniref:Protein ApaG n=1 Tax=Cohaesibacter celericrescens TaxID=2067669 RepID=A0A2N5XMZ6_9HYPH|nr:Co2+/Mg2+ efflux protein ApaG [Cohaesibacter celericrescens]PLW75787.1 Co2+/Mg2+ efflux protein ApaG [Cohaesibacter celericrescens]